MAANKKASNTSKTAHVMNLISKNKEPAPEEAEVRSAPEAPAAAPAASAAPPVIASLSSDAAVSDQIKNALEGELKAEVPAPAPQPAPAPVVMPEALTSAPVAETAPPHVIEFTSESAAAPAVQPAPAPAAAPVAAAPAPQPAPAPAVPQPAPAAAAPAPQPAPAPAPEPEPEPEEHELAYINVMQALVEEKAPKYIKMFGMCQCERCLIDVKATALNNLTPKYVVMKKGEMIPRITLYEGRFNTTVTAQLLNACKLVMDNPRH